MNALQFSLRIFFAFVAVVLLMGAYALGTFDRSLDDEKIAWACFDGCYNMLEVQDGGNVSNRDYPGFEACADLCLERHMGPEYVAGSGGSS